MRLEATIALHRAAVARVAAALRAAPDGAQPVRGLRWSIDELGAHLLASTRGYRLAAEEAIPPWPDLVDGAAHNEVLLRAVPEHGLDLVADTLSAETELLHAAWRSAPVSVSWNADLHLPVETAAALHLGELVVHGWELAATLGLPRTIDDAAAAAVWAGEIAIAPYFLTEEARDFVGTFAVRLRGHGVDTLTFDRGALSVAPGRPDRADCRISADPAAFLLVSYGRIPVAGPALTGRVLAYGRKPWLGLRLPGLFRAP